MKKTHTYRIQIDRYTKKNASAEKKPAYTGNKHIRIASKRAVT